MFYNMHRVVSCLGCGRVLTAKQFPTIYQTVETSILRQLGMSTNSNGQPAQVYSSTIIQKQFVNRRKFYLTDVLHRKYLSNSAVLHNTTTDNTKSTVQTNTKSSPQENTRTAAEEKLVKEKDNIVTIPNMLCVSRIIAAPILTNLIVQGEFEKASLLFMAAGFTDLLDGWIARNFKGQSSSLGSFLDPLADKILVCTLYLSLTFANLIPPSLCSLIVSRDLFLVYAGLYIRYMSVPPPFTIKKYFDVSLPTATVQPTTISKINTGLQFLLITVSLGGPVFGYTGHPALHYLWAATGTTTFLSAVSYAFVKDTYKFAHREYDHQFGKKLTAFILFILFNIIFTIKFPTQKIDTKPGEDKECPLTGTKGGDCPIVEDQDEEDFYSERSNQYYLKQIKATR